MQDSHSCDPGSIPGRRTVFFYLFLNALIKTISEEFVLTRTSDTKVKLQRN
uniref:Uncharacterized protein n=1 Tax=Anguilla anguilla TaxID=7936 RepID=A0A0E9U329_ANGAN